MANPDDLSWFDPNFAAPPAAQGLMAAPPPTGSGLFGRLGFGAPLGSPQSDAMMTAAASLLSGSGWSPVRRSSADILGSALLAGQQARAQAQDRIQKQKLQEAQIATLQNPQTDDIKEFQYAKQNGYTGSFDQWQTLKLANRAEPPASLQELSSINAARKAQGLPEYTIEDWYRVKSDMALKPFLADVNKVPTLVQPTNRSGGVIANPLSSGASEDQAAADRAAAAATGTKGAERLQTQIDTGIDAADSVATVKRGLELLNSVPTGGIDAAKLKATNLFGVTGADEAELSANLGKAVLAQLRSTFGAAFTEKEGTRLAEIEAGFGKSTEGNKRLLEQAQKILERAARRGIRAAELSGDADSAKEISDALDFTLSQKSDTSTGLPDDIAALVKKHGGK